MDPTYHMHEVERITSRFSSHSHSLSHFLSSTFLSRKQEQGGTRERKKREMGKRRREESRATRSGLFQAQEHLHLNL
jgi:hypothetical protein